MSDKVYQIVTDEIIKRLQKGVIPWRQPWKGGEPPKNLISKRPYTGINLWLLSCTKHVSPYWLTFKQAQQAGGKIKKGEKATLIVFWKQVEVEPESKDEKPKTIPFLRYYKVFNVEQCTGLDNKIPEIEINKNFRPIEACEKTVASMPKKPRIQSQENRAYYNPMQDFVNIPPKEVFEKEEYYYSVLFHELGHSTGHETRLNRKTLKTWAPFGTKEYSKEELVAEMTASFLCGIHKIEWETIENSAAYIQNWLKKLKNDCRMVIKAAAQAQKASDFILGKIQ